MAKITGRKTLAGSFPMSFPGVRGQSSWTQIPGDTTGKSDLPRHPTALFEKNVWIVFWATFQRPAAPARQRKKLRSARAYWTRVAGLDTASRTRRSMASSPGGAGRGTRLVGSGIEEGVP